MPYTKKAWLDHIVDGSGAVVQQGTPLNAQNMNHIEEGLANALAVTPSDLGAVSAYSGVLDTPAINSTFSDSATIPGGQLQVPAAVWYYMGINAIAMPGSRMPNSFLIAGNVVRFSKDSENFVPFTGVSAGLHKIVLPDPPTEGSRDDLLLLEAWKDQATQAWKCRVRAVAGVDFSKTYASVDYTGWSDNTNHTNITPQGGLTEPIPAVVGSISSANLLINVFRPSYGANYQSTAPIIDMGLWVAGTGSDTSKSALKTYDGFVYAIPLAKINRRNSGGYSVNNPNGARDFYQVLTTTLTGASGSFNPKEVRQVSVPSTAGMRVGDVLARQGSTSFTLDVVSVDSATLVTVKESSNNTGSFQVGVTGQTWILSKSDRPDGLFSNIVSFRDITDLRHKTYLAAPSYDQLLIDGLDQVLRGANQVERPLAMRKTYVGIKKTPLDANHIFYASMDSTVTAEVGTLTTVPMGQNGSGFQPMPTGAGYRTPSAAAAQYTDLIPTSGLGTVFTLEFFLDLSQGPAIASDARTIAEIRDTNNLGLLRLLCNPTTFDTVQIQTVTATAAYGTTTSVNTPAKNKASKRAHFRLTYNNGTINLYIDGNLMLTLTHTLVRAATKIGLTRSIAGIEGSSGNETYPSAYFIYSDVAISKVDRGAVFATLPADFSQGYADITPAFNYQRRVNSDAQTSQKTYASAKVKNATQESGITVTKGSGTNTAAWEAGDKIKVKGLAGETISGITDADTARAKILSNTTNQLTLDSVAGLAVSDAVYFRDSSGFGDFESTTVTAIDAATNTITVSSVMTVNRYANQSLYEITASTSSPVVRAIIAGVSTTVSGTWTGLAKNEAEVTLGTLPGGLAAQDIIIEYSLNMAAGQGGLYQVYTSVLTGEANGKKLTPSLVALTDDFVGKIAGSTTVNPHKLYAATNGTAATIGAPGTEFSQGDYDAVKQLDNSLKVITTSVNGQQATAFIAIDVIRAYEDKYGKIPGAYTTAEKVSWLRSNHSKVTCSVSAYGSGPAGNSAALYQWNTAAWVLRSSNPANAIAQINGPWTDMTTCINNDGFVYFLATTAASDGTTPSVLYVDHITVSFEVVSRAGYDVLTPENTRRDAGLGGVLYVRKVTREVESLFWGNDEDNGIVVIGEYLPTQEFAIQASATLSGATNVLTGIHGFITTAGTNAGTDGGLNYYLNAISRLLGPGDDLNYKVDPQSLIGTLPYTTGGGATPQIRYVAADTALVTGRVDAQYTDGIPAWAAKAAEFLSGWPVLQQYNGELVLRIALRKRSQLASVGIGGGTVHVFFRLPGRPLVKL